MLRHRKSEASQDRTIENTPIELPPIAMTPNVFRDKLDCLLPRFAKILAHRILHRNSCPTHRTKWS